jgi:hypothetical protein
MARQRVYLGKPLYDEMKTRFDALGQVVDLNGAGAMP